MSILSIRNLKIPAKHGVFDFEKNKTGIFEIDIHIHLVLENALLHSLNFGRINFFKIVI